MNIIEYAKKYTGLQETAGSNRGPLVDKWKGMVSKGLTTLPIPWCGCFVFAMISELTGLNRAQMAAALKFDPKKWYPESCDSWLAMGRAAGLVTSAPSTGDLFLIMKTLRPGVHSMNDAIHIGFVASDKVKLGSPFRTLEGNTVGTGEGANSREGNSVAGRSRAFSSQSAFVFLAIPNNLKRVEKETP